MSREFLGEERGRTEIGEKGIRMGKRAARRERNFRNKGNNWKKASKEKLWLWEKQCRAAKKGVER